MSVCIFPLMLIVWMAILGQIMAQMNNDTDYCKLDCDGIENSACNCSKVGDHCKDPEADPHTLQTFRRWMVEIHNDLRNKVALGRERRSGLELGASNMHTIDYDYELEKVARCYMNKCPRRQQDKCRRTENFPSVGQNMMVSFGMKDSRNELRNCVMDWYNEVLTLVPEEMRKIQQSFYLVYPGCHFTQLIWAHTTHVGCARYFDTQRLNQGVPDRYAMMLVCNYGPRGNIWKEKTYKIGKSCSNCDEEDKCNDKWKGLCGEVTLEGVNATEMPVTGRAVKWWGLKYNIAVTVSWVLLVVLNLL